MAQLNFDFDRHYRPVLEQAQQSLQASGELSDFQQGQAGAMSDLQERMRESAGQFQPQQQARQQAVQKVAGGSRQYLQDMPDTIDPMTRAQLAQSRSAQDIGQLAGATDTLRGLRAGADQLAGQAMEFRGAEEARLQGAVEQAAMRYGLTREEADTAYNMAVDEWSRGMEEQRMALQRQQVAQAGAAAAEARRARESQERMQQMMMGGEMVEGAWNTLLTEAQQDLSNRLQSGGIDALEGLNPDEYQQQYIWGQLMSDRFTDNPFLDKEGLWSMWRGLPNNVGAYGYGGDDMAAFDRGVEEQLALGSPPMSSGQSYSPVSFGLDALTRVPTTRPQLGEDISMGSGGISDLLSQPTTRADVYNPNWNR